MRLPIFFLLAALLVVACAKTSDEEQIAQTITAMSEAVENKEFMAIKPHLHESFRANERMDAREVNRLLAMYAMQHKSLGVTIIGSKTTLDEIYPDRATTVLSVVTTGSSGRLSSDGSVRTVEIEWIKDSGDWLVRTANWEH